MINKHIALLALAASLSLNTFAQKDQPKDNSLTKEEKKEGFTLLFDGKSAKGWHNYNAQGVNPKWAVDNGSLHLTEKGGGDLVTDQKYENFELRLDWKISEGGNSGIFFLGVEDPKYNTIWKTAPEMQVLDDARHSDNKLLNHRSGSLYDLMGCYPQAARPAGQWNQAVIRLNKGELELWLNGSMQVKTTMWTEDWNHMVANSKFASLAPDFGKARSGVIGLQDHGDKVWFKNIRIRRL